MFKKKPMIVIYKNLPELEWSENRYLSDICSKQDLHSFRCSVCGKPLKIGFPRCPFCNIRLKWEYPFKTKVVDAGSGEKYDR